MKITTQNLTIILALILGFSLHALSNNNLQMNVGQAILGDSLKQKLKNNSSEINSTYAIGNSPLKRLSIFDKFNNQPKDEVLELKLTTDVQSLINNKKGEEYQVAFIEMEDATGQLVKHELKIKPRGKFRRKVCDFPPLKLNFSKSKLEKEGLNSEFDKLKLVTHCTDDRYDSKQNVLREFLTYQMYNALTNKSFRVRLVKIKYVDLHNSHRAITRFGFLIEDKDEMATRLNGEICDCRGLAQESIASTPYSIMTMFQYMIGNEDWDYQMLRNVKIVKSTSDSVNNIIVPYDFDFSGIVNAPYAIPSPDLKHSTVAQRHFFGRFNDEQDYQATAQIFINQKKELYRLVKAFKTLSISSRLEITEYLNEFYDILENEEIATDIFLNRNASVEQIAR